MGRNELVKRLAKKIYGNASVREVQECVNFCDSLVDVIKEALIDGEKITWSGFMTLEVKERAERQGRNPQTNEVVTFPPVKSVKCKVNKEIKNLVNGK